MNGKLVKPGILDLCETLFYSKIKPHVNQALENPVKFFRDQMPIVPINDLLINLQQRLKHLRNERGGRGAPVIEWSTALQMDQILK